MCTYQFKGDKKMKRFTAFFLLFSLICSLAACGDLTPQSSEQTAAATVPVTTADTVSVPETTAPAAPTTEATTAPTSASNPTPVSAFLLFIQDYLDLSEYNVSYSNDNHCRYSRKSANQTTVPADCYFVICGSKIEVGKMTVSDLTDLGWELVGNARRYLAAHQSSSYYAFEKDGKRIQIEVYNPADQSIEFADATVSSVYIKNYDYADNYAKLETASEFSVSWKINQDSSLSGIVNAFGEPNEVEYYHADSKYSSYSYIVLDYGDYGKNGSMTIKLSGSGNKIAEFTLRVRP